MYEIYNNLNNINTALTNIDGTELSTSYSYWSSSEYASTSGWYVNFSDGDVEIDSKGNAHYVRLVRDI